jgi:catechol 2,3-dioxygenase-like lactoylglutathione lyase family enzyme
MKHYGLIPLLMLAAGVATVAQEPKPARPRISGVAGMAVSSRDQMKSRQFYGDFLGLAQCKGSESLCFQVNERQSIEVDPFLVYDVALETSDSAAIRTYLKSRNVAVSEMITQKTGALSFNAVDPEKHRIRFVQHTESLMRQTSGHSVSQQMIHVGFVVHDRAAEDHFYKDILGFHLYWQGGRKDDETDWVNMQVPDGTDWIEYMLNVPANADHHTLGVMNHIALGVPDIHAAEAQLRKNGWTGAEPPKIGRGGKWQLNLYDPDDTRVELMEFTPTQKPCCSEYTGPHPKP